MFWFWEHRHVIDMTLCAILLSCFALFYIWCFVTWLYDEVSWRTQRLVRRIKEAFGRKQK